VASDRRPVRRGVEYIEERKEAGKPITTAGQAILPTVSKKAPTPRKRIRRRVTTLEKLLGDIAYERDQMTVALRIYLRTA
jgi:hypothetical protein